MGIEDLEFSEINSAIEDLGDRVILEHITCIKDVPTLDELQEIFGNPEKESAVWEMASDELRDSIMCEKYCIEALTGKKLSEEAILSDLEKIRKYDREYGCVLTDIGKYAEMMGLTVISESGLTIKDLCQSIDNNEKIICSVSSVAMNFPEINDIPGLVADKYVEIIGVNIISQNQIDIILNDPCEKNGGTVINDSVFNTAWEKSGFFATFISSAVR